MDVSAFVQENKRWLIGVALGGVAYLIGSAVVTSIYDVDQVRSSQRQLLRNAGSTPLYDGGVLAAARTEAEQLAAERQRLEAELAFVQSPTYQLAGQVAPPDQYQFQVGRALQQAVLTAASERDVQVEDKNISWPLLSGPDEIRGVLFGLELLDELAQRLFAAHDAVRAADPDALGLRALTSLKVEPRRTTRAASRPRPGEVDLRDLVTQERVSFEFQADAATCAQLLEACREPGRTLVIDTWRMQQPARLGEPCTVKGSLQGIALVAPEVQEQ